jgi:hypothetical protein
MAQRVFSTAAMTAAAGWKDSDVTERCAKPMRPEGPTTKIERR